MKKLILILSLFVLMGGAGVGGFYNWQKQKEDKFLSTDPRTKDAYAVVQKRQKQLRKEKDNYDAYMSLAFHWKGIGEVLKEEKYLERALTVYSRVIKLWGPKAYLPFFNQANVYIALGDYRHAEENLKIALEIDPGEQNLYISLADLYRNFLKKDKKEIMAVYENGLRRVVGGGNLVAQYAGYLAEAGEYTKAIDYYQRLVKAYPSETNYVIMIKELEAKLNVE